MANMKYSKRLLKRVQNAYKKQDSDPSGSRPPSKEYQRVDSSPNRHLGAVSLDTNMSRIDKLDPVLINIGPQMTIGDDERWMIPFEPASPPSFVDTPDSIPLLNLHHFRPDPAAMRTTNHGRVQNQSPTKAQLSQPAPFRVIIVGGGPTGLVLAHALHQAGIEYILLELSPTIPTTPGPETEDDSGITSLLLWPNSARILDQLSLLRQTCKLACPVRTRQTYLADGTPCSPGDADVFARARHDHGRPCMLIDRTALLRLLWESLPGREARVRMGREVVSTETYDAGVRVVCADGAVEEGSVVVGCDGVHGVVRRAVCELRAERKTRRGFGLASLGGGGSGKADRTMEARYYGLVGSAPLLDGLEAGVCYETRGDDWGTTFQVLAGDDTAHFLVYIPLHRPTHKRTEYPAQNADYLAGALADHPITDKLKFGDLWRARRSGKMVDFHEGIAEKWYHERIVLAGDAAHSMTPVLGLGVNTGWQGVAELTNGLRRLLLLLHHLPSSGPDTASIKRVFKAYQHAREDHARTAALVSSFYARAIAHQGRLSRFCNWAAPGVTGDVALLDRQAAWAVRQGVTLEFVGERHFKEGRLKWANPRRRIDAASAEGRRRGETVWVYPGIPIRVGAN